MKQNILLIEENNNLSPYIEKTLENDYKIIVIEKVKHYNELLNKSNICLAIFDQSIEIECEEIINNKYPLIILSETSIKDSSLLNKYYIKKPFSFITLLIKIREISGKNLQNPNILGIDDLLINTTNCIVTRGTKLITLTKKEYKLIHFLLKNKDKAVSRSDLLEHVWGMQIDPFSNTVEAHVFSLRKKIDRGHKMKLIHTIPKYGYRVSEEK